MLSIFYDNLLTIDEKQRVLQYKTFHLTYQTEKFQGKEFPELKGLKARLVSSAPGSQTVILDNNLIYNKGDYLQGRNGESLPRGWETFKFEEIPELRGKKIKQVLNSNFTTVVLVDDGKVWGWGLNAHQQLGFHLYNQWTPQYLYTPSKIVKIALSSTHCLMLDKNQRLYALGDFFLDSIILSHHQGLAELTRLFPPHLRQVIGGKNCCFALYDDGSVYGLGKPKRIGLDKEVEASNYAVLIPKLKNIVALQSGDDYFVALDNNGNLFSWGNNEFGKTGHALDNKYVIQPTQIPNLDQITHFHVGHNITLALRKDGAVFAFGYNGDYFGPPKQLDEKVASKLRYALQHNKPAPKSFSFKPNLFQDHKRLTDADMHFAAENRYR